MDEPEELAKTKAIESLRTLGLAGVSLVPYIGGASATILDKILPSPIGRRRLAWLESLEARLRDLEGLLEVPIEDLARNEEFVNAVLRATYIAQFTHQEEKLEALRNAVANVAAGFSPEADEQATFLRFLDELTPTHVSLMRLLYQARFGYPELTVPPPPAKEPEEGLAAELPGYLEGTRKSLYLQAAKDLQDRGLLNPENNYEAILENRALSIWGIRTEFGERFLRFIERPSIDNESDSP